MVGSNYPGGSYPAQGAGGVLSVNVVTVNATTQAFVLTTYPVTVDVKYTSVQNSGGWEVWIHHRRRLAKRLEEERLEEIEQQRNLLEQAQQAIAEAEAKEKAERFKRTNDKIRKSDQQIISLRKTIASENRLADEIQERIYRMVVLNALEIDTLEKQIEIERKRRRNAVALLLLAA
jgi:hypothetical protein